MTTPTYGSGGVGAAALPALTTWAGELDAEAAGAVRDGTILSSAMNLAACALGASMLSLPYAMMVAGPGVALGMLCLFAVMAFFAGQAVVNAGLRARQSSYAAIVRDAFGKEAGYVAEVLLSVALLVAGVSYICGLSDLIPVLLPATKGLSRNFLIVVVLLILFPVTLITSLAAFGPVSTVAAAGCYVQMVAVIAELFVQTDADDTWSVPPAGTLLGVSLPGLLYVSPMVCFVFAYHYLLTETLDELQDPTPARMRMVNLTTVGVLFGCYFPLAIAGYLNYAGTNIPTNMLAAMNENSAAVLIARVVIAGLLFGTYSLFIIPLRRKVEKAAFGRATVEYLAPRRIAVAALLAIFVGVMSVSLDLGLANSVAGGCIALVMFLFPGLLMLHGQFSAYASAGPRDTRRVAIGGAFVVAGAVIAIIGMFGSALFDY